MTTNRWTQQKAKQWFSSQTFRQGANFLPSSAANQIEMWINPDWETIDRELGLAASLNYNSMRVFLHDLMWIHEGDNFFYKVDIFLSICQGHGISPILVIFDSCWHPYPVYGFQLAPRPHVHGSRWLQSPGRLLIEHSSIDTFYLESYVKAVVERFGNDARVAVLDLWNEPFANNRNSYGSHGVRVPAAEDARGLEMNISRKEELVLALLPKVFEWARSALGERHEVPFTVGVYRDDAYQQNPGWNISLSESDVISFHSYAAAPHVQAEIQDLLKLDRPILCTEYMARALNSTFDPVLGLMYKHNVWAYNWGLVAGKQQTQYPWDSWQKVYMKEPELWHHNVLRKDGTPFSFPEQQYLLSYQSDYTKLHESVIERSAVNSSVQFLTITVFLCFVYWWKRDPSK